jgi:release factor glutamine methyltransferase
MTTGYWLKTATQFLQSRAITTARLDCLVLLEDAMQINRAQLLAEPDKDMRDGLVNHLQKLLVRRSKHEPLAYIRGRSEFYGRNFVINQHVLTPRPESEMMIDLLKELYPAPDESAPYSFSASNTQKRLLIADVGAGTGALGITAAMELENASVDLLEIDDEALKVAERNVDLMTSHVTVKKSDLLLGGLKSYEVLLCNLPYVPDAYEINKAASFEPKIALFGGPDGLDLFRRLFEQVSELADRPLYILTEALPSTHDALLAIAVATGYRLLRTEDFIQVFTPN